jgi:hypothetical protein
MPECVRLYNDGSYVKEERTPKQVEAWLAYNKTFRFGTALFVDGVCKETGVYISKERCDEFEKKLKRR